MIVTPAEALASVARPPAARGRPTLSQLAQAFLRWLEAHHRPQTTIGSYGDGLGAFLTYANGVGIGMEYPGRQARAAQTAPHVRDLPALTTARSSRRSNASSATPTFGPR